MIFMTLEQDFVMYLMSVISISSWRGFYLGPISCRYLVVATFILCVLFVEPRQKNHVSTCAFYPGT